MKKIIALFMTLSMIFGLSACGMPAFHEDALTDAQAYTKAAMADYEIHRGYEFRSAKVMLTSDLAADLKGKVDIKKWDLSDAAAVVLIEIGEETKGTGENVKAESSSKADGDAASSGGDEQGEDNGLIVYVLDSSKKVLYDKVIKNPGSLSAAADVDEIGQEQKEEINNLRREQAKKELALESFLSEKSAEIGELAADFEAKYVKDAQYKYSDENIARLLSNATFASYYNSFIEIEHLKAYIKEAGEENGFLVLDTSEMSLAKNDEELDGQKLELAKNLYNTKQKLAAYCGAHKAEVDAFHAKIDEMKKSDANYMLSADYFRLCCANDVNNGYDAILRQKENYQKKYDVFCECEKTNDIKKRDYMLNRVDTENQCSSEYANAYKIYVQRMVDHEKFLSANAEQVKNYESELAAAKKAAGSDYKNDVGYIKVEIKYEDLIKNKDAQETTVKNALKSAEDIKTKYDEMLKKMDTNEKDRVKEKAIGAEKSSFIEYLSGDIEAVSEYDAKPGQWGELHPDYAAYQNSHLNYYVAPVTTHHYSNTNTKPKTNSNGDIKYNPNDEDYASHDYNNDGYMSTKEFQDAMNDKVNEMLNSMD